MTIVEELRNNRESGAKRLESEYKAGLMTLALRFCADLGDAEELVNRTFAVVVERIDDYLEQSAFFAWMCQILSHLHSEDVRRKSNRTVIYPGEIPTCPDEGAEERIFNDVDASIVRDAVEGLPEDLRETIVLHYFTGLSVPQIARFVRIPAGTVKSRLHYARKALMAKFATKAHEAAKKPGTKALLIVLALAAFTAIGAAGVAAIRAATTGNAECRMHNAECRMHNAECQDAFPAEGFSAAESNRESAASDSSTLQSFNPSTNAASSFDFQLSTFDETKEQPMNTQTRSSILAAASLAIAAAPGTLRADIQPSADPAATRQSIQDAIDAAAVANPVGTVTLGNGLFEIDSQLMVTNGVTVAGQGWEKTILKQTANEQRVATLQGGSKLEGVTVTGGRLTANWSHGPGLIVEDGTVSWCCISNNVSTGRNVHGGGVNITKGTIDHSIVAFNQAGTYTSSGGGIGTYNSSSTFVIDTCLVYGNTASVTDSTGKGGGICVNMGNPPVTIRNTTITGNSSSGSGGGFSNASYGNKVKLVNTIVSGNTAPSSADASSGTLASGSEGNLIGDDPRFVDAPNNDYHLAVGSPAINSGVAYEGIGDDLDGVAFAAPPSIGCYEYFGVLLVDDPAFSPASGVTFSPTLDVALTCATDGATIRYTLDGTDPTEASAEYTGLIALSATTTIRARAYKAGMAESGIVEATYTLGAPTPPQLGAVTVTPRMTAATVSGEILSIGNNLATACDVWVAIGTSSAALGEAALVASGVTTSFEFAIPRLATETTYFYSLTVSNDAQVVQGTSVNGQFTTTAKQALEPVAGDPAATRSRIQEEIDAAALMSPAGTVTLGKGVFEIDAQLLVTNGVALVGQGWEKTVVKQTVAGSNARCATVNGGARIEGVTLTGGHIRERWQSGAGVLVEDGTISWCCITNNQTGDATWAGFAVNNNYGAGVHIKQGTVDHTIIAQNAAYANGGGNSHGGGLGVQNPTGPILVDTCLFHGNRAPSGKGGAICAELGNYHNLLTVRNTTIANNTASGDGGGVYVSEYYAANKFSFALANSILADNVSGGEGADPNLALPGDDRIVSGYAAQSSGNLLANGTEAFGEGSKSVAGSGAAWFKGAADGNYRIRSASPAAGLGTWYEGIPEDLNHVERRPKPAAGCYEASGRGTILSLR